MLRKNTLIVVAVFAALLLVLLLLQPGEEQALEDAFPTTAPAVYLLNFSPVEINQLSVKNLDGEGVTMLLEEDRWALADPLKSPDEVDQLRVGSVIDQLGSLQVIAELEAGLDLHRIGLAFPAYTIVITRLSGEALTIRIGDPAPTGSGYYAVVNGSNPVLLSRSVLDQALQLIDSPPLNPTPIPEPSGVITDTSVISETLEGDSP